MTELDSTPKKGSGILFIVLVLSLLVLAYMAFIYAKKNTSTQAPNGTATVFPFVNAVKEGSEQVYLNGLLLDAGDYSATVVNGMVTEVTFGAAPASADKVVFYGVYGNFTQVNFS